GAGGDRVEPRLVAADDVLPPGAGAARVVGGGGGVGPRVPAARVAGGCLAPGAGRTAAILPRRSRGSRAAGAARGALGGRFLPPGGAGGGPVPAAPGDPLVRAVRRGARLGLRDGAGVADLRAGGDPQERRDGRLRRRGADALAALGGTGTVRTRPAAPLAAPPRRRGSDLADPRQPEPGAALRPGLSPAGL